MGGRGAFVDVKSHDFQFIENGQVYQTIGEVDGVRVLVQNKGAVKAPEFSHTENRMYAIIQKGALKHLSFYDDEHRQAVSIDLMHEHGKDRLRPHKHLYLDHSDKGISITPKELEMIRKIKRRFNLK